jgi:hypothetical protein
VEVHSKKCPFTTIGTAQLLVTSAEKLSDASPLIKMERNDLYLRERIRRLLETYSLEEILEQCDETAEDILVFLYFEYGLKFPEEPM